MSIDDDFWIDECFRVTKERFLWTSYNKDGSGIISSLTKDQCIDATRFYLKGKQEGFPEPGVVHEGVVGGKL